MSLKGHTDVVVNLLFIDELDLLASGSMDGSIIVWDIYMSKIRQRHVGHSGKGVACLAFYAPERFLISGGYDHEVLVWSLFVNNLVHKLSGHGCTVSALVCNIQRAELISGDCQGVLKVSEGDS